MRKIFIDAGAYNGDSIDAFKKIRSDWNEFEIHAFEANPELSKHFSGKDINFYNKAVWIEDGEVDFFIGGDDNGSTLVETKTSGRVNYDNPVKVEGIDIDRWIKENFSLADKLILKMDIEGGEFEVIPHMIKNGSIKYINEMWVEMHANKVTKYLSTDKDKLIEDIKNCGVIFKDWH